MRKCHDGGEKENGKKSGKMFLVATNVITSRPPERRPTGTPHARANSLITIRLPIKLSAYFLTVNDLFSLWLAN